ncbi:hypothetical protein K466DRAFT_326016 [Polyporus arcularius HHB13444]|uniref:Uncharacterized protein n=1 Tax=Polyporus arcularius HHB13444 TaxID=1314778 RepID=A0A5C3Q088_9APHY|nr:hypothetical protein K466DRAFT_326016 [Polyporus arcularius HHB13444]
MQNSWNLKQIIIVTIATIVGMPLMLVLIVPVVLVVWRSTFRRQQDILVLNRAHARTVTRSSDWPKLYSVHIAPELPESCSSAAGHVLAERAADGLYEVCSTEWASIKPISCWRAAPSERRTCSIAPCGRPREGWRCWPPAPLVASRSRRLPSDEFELQLTHSSRPAVPSTASAAETFASRSDAIRTAVLIRMPHSETKKRRAERADHGGGLPCMEFGVWP